MIRIQKNAQEKTITVTINNVAVVLTIGEWSRIIAREGTAFGEVKNLA